MTTNNEIRYVFEPIIIDQEEIEYFESLRTSRLHREIEYFQENLESLNIHIRFLKNQYFTLIRRNIVDTLTWDEVHEIQEAYVNKRVELLQHKNLKERKIGIIQDIIARRQP